MDWTEQNRETFSSPVVIGHYQQLAELFPPEQTILALLRDYLPEWRLLDIGVGAGRTTRFFAPLVKEYWGIDYAPGMIASCRQNFPDYKFLVADAKSMPELAADYFDLVLISYNGLDYCGPQERSQILQEVHRVLRQGGYFCFSSHNLQALPRLFRLKYSWNPFILWRRWQHWRRLRQLNASWLAAPATADFALIYDGAHQFQLRHYYIKPVAQVRQLQEHGFRDLRLFALNGQELTAEAAIAANTDYMIYYLCRKA